MPVLNENGKIPAMEWIKVMKPLLDEGHSLSITPQGQSMIPFLSGGRDKAVLQSAAGVRLRRGDIILYPSPERDFMILHRIHHIRDGNCYPLGDARTDIEPPVAPQDVCAVVGESVRKGKRISRENRWYLFLVNLWLILRPLRPFIIRSYFAAKHAAEKVRRS